MLAKLFILLLNVLSLNLISGMDKADLVAIPTIDHSWDSGYQMSIKLKNNSPAIINDWKVEFDLKNKSANFKSGWNGNYTAKGNHIVISPLTWNKTICQGCEIKDIGFLIDSPKGVPHGVDNIKAYITEKAKVQKTIQEPSKENPASQEVKKQDDKKAKTGIINETKKIDELPAKLDHPKQEQSNNLKVVVYFASWSRYWKAPSGQTGEFSPKIIEANNITHINYAFIKPLLADELVKLNENELNDVNTFRKILTDPWADIEIGTNWSNPSKFAGNIGEINDLKKRYPHLKILISVGGWTLSDNFSQIAANPLARTNLFKLLINFCKYYNFDGIDFDWEYPGFSEHSGRPEDKKNFTIFLSEIYNMAKKEKNPLLVTIAAPAGADHMQNIEFDKIHNYLDWINAMTYDFHGPWGGGNDNVTNHTAPLYATKIGDKRYNIDYAINYYLSNKVPADKIVLGLNFNGRSYGNVDSTTDGLFSAYKGAGPGTIEDGVMAFPSLPTFDLKTLKASGGLLDQGYKRYWDDTSKVPYLFGNPGGRFNKVFISYDDLQSFKIKIEYLKKRGLAGVMFWQLDWNVWPVLAEIKRLLQ